MYSAVAPELNSAQMLASRISGKHIGHEKPFTARDVYLKGWKGLESAEVVNMATETLIKANWIQKKNKPSAHFGGRPSVQFVVNLKIWEVDRHVLL
jgi:hypothetical protein